MTRKTGQEIGHFARIKKYPGGLVEIMAAERPIFREPGWELSHLWDSDTGGRGGQQAGAPEDQPEAERGAPAEADKEGSAIRAMRRARARVRDIALCNDFRYFVTLTLDGERIDRYDMREITRKLNQWLSNAVKRQGLKYVLVPERHQDGAIHFHGFFNDALEAADSGTMVPPGGGKPRKPRSAAQRAAWQASGGRVVYNLPRWTWGFTTALELYGDYSAAVGYVCKYIGKQGDKPGGRWYYSGGDLAAPEQTYAEISVTDLAEQEGAYTFRVDGAALGMAIWRGREVEIVEKGNHFGCGEPCG